MTMSTGSKVAIGCGLASVFGCVLSCVAFMVWASVGKQGGVRYSNNAEQYAVDYMTAHGLLETDERLVAYYDVTLSLDATELAILTDRRVIYSAPGGVEAIALTDIMDVTATDQGAVGTLIAVHGPLSVMAIVVAPLNGADGFHDAILRAWHVAVPSHAVDAGAPDAALMLQGLSDDAGLSP